MMRAPTPLWSRGSRDSTQTPPEGCRFQRVPVSIAAHGHWSPGRQAAPPSSCSGRGVVRAYRRLRLTRRASPVRTDGWSPAAGIAFGQHVFSATTRDLSTSRLSSSSTWNRSTSLVPATAWAASRSKPPMKAANRRKRIRSGSVSSACDQSTEARNVCCRRTAVRAPPVSSRNRSCRLSRISSSDSARTRAAASSMANGMPSRRRQISATVSASPSVIAKSGLARRARSLNNSTASSARDNDGTCQFTSPPTMRGSRLVARIATLEQPASKSLTRFCAGLQQMLAVVQHQQQPSLADEAQQRLE